MAVETLSVSVPATRLILIILTTIYAVILTPLSLYYARQLWILNMRNIPFITKRHPRVVILSVFVFNAYIVIIRPISDLAALYRLQLAMSLANLSTIGLIIITLRVWLLFYDYNHSLHTVTLKWQTQITKEIPPTTPWTARYKWMGDVKTLFCITAVVCIVVLTTTFVCQVVFGSVTIYYTRIVIAVLFIIFMVVLIFNVRSCRDGFYIQKEFKLLMICMFISVLIFCAISLLFERDSNIQLLAANIWISITSYILSFVQTIWVIKQYASEVPDRRHQPALSMSGMSNTESKLTFEEIVRTQDGFDVFANHLIREFSTENLFFLYEVMQVKNEMLMKKLVKEDDIGFVLSFDLQSMTSIRRADSTVNDVNDLRKTVRYIIEQYIETGSQYSVNLSARNRMGMLHAYDQLEGGGKLVVEAAIEIVYDDEDGRFENEQTSDSVDFGKINELELNKQYIVLFDDAMREIVLLLKSDSLRRFYQTNEYKTMIQNTQ